MDFVYSIVELIQPYKMKKLFYILLCVSFGVCGQDHPKVGDLINGGIVFYINTEESYGLIASTSDLEEKYIWGCFNTYLNGAQAAVIGMGSQNTSDIVSECPNKTIAARKAIEHEFDGYSDWYLPSRQELLEMYSKIGPQSQVSNITEFQNRWYWSSTEESKYHAWTVNMTSGEEFFGLKDQFGLVRVIRTFYLE